jgi:hypothetical protein
MIDSGLTTIQTSGPVGCSISTLPLPTQHCG